MYKVKEPIKITNPELIKEWDFELNKDINIDDITIGSHKKVWWTCFREHKWEAAVYHRKNRGCPYCNGKKAIKGENDIFSLFPDLKNEWDFEKNEIDPEEILPNSKKMAWWICPEGHTYETKIVNRAQKRHKCPICSNQLIVPGINDLETIYPDLAKEWDFELNDTLPSMVAPSAKASYHWICEQKHKWKATINKRTSQGTGCPVCSNSVVLAGVNDLATVSPELSEEWSSKNDKSPSEITIGSKYKAIWKCSKCNNEWQSPVYVRKQCGCPRCKESKGEKEISKYLNDNFIEYFTQYRFDDCRYKNTLPFDFAIAKSGKICGLIEYDGIQHYECVDFGNLTKQEQQDNLNEIRIKDNIKTNYCANVGLPLLRIKYTDYDNISILLDKYIKSILYCKTATNV